MIAQNQNYMEVEIGGKKRKVVFDMLTTSMVATWLQTEPTGLYNPVLRTLKSIEFGLTRKSNTLPKDFDVEMLSEWITAMPQEVYDELESFANKAMGFMVAAINKTLDNLEIQTQAEA